MALALTAGASGASAGPPESRLPQGRELDPVARDYYLPQPPGAPIAPAAPERAGDAAPGPRGASLLEALWESVLSEFTIPLGTAEAADLGV